MWWLYVVLFFCCWFFFDWLFKAKEKPIDLSKNSDYYKEQFPEILGEPEIAKPTVEEHIHLHITNNHLHIHTKGEGS